MKRTVFICISCLFINGCNYTTIEEKFSEIRNEDYSSVTGMEIRRQGRHSVVITYNGHKFVAKQGRIDPSVIKRAETVAGDSLVVLPFSERKYSKALTIFSTLSASWLKVDMNGNVFIEIPWNYKYTDCFIRVQPGCSIDELLTNICLPEESMVCNTDNWYMFRLNKNEVGLNEQLTNQK